MFMLQSRLRSPESKFQIQTHLNLSIFNQTLFHFNPKTLSLLPNPSFIFLIKRLLSVHILSHISKKVPSRMWYEREHGLCLFIVHG
ncbi:hypothetical protein Hanom_Chr01g00013351 [Helianthus anomalus]